MQASAADHEEIVPLSFGIERLHGMLVDKIDLRRETADMFEY